MSENSSRLLLIGSSVRAAAASAVRAGFEVFAIDRFSDADLQRLVTVVPIAHWPNGIIAAVQQLPTMPWMYCGSIENDPDLVAQVSRHHQLFGNHSEVLKLIRDPFWVEATLSARDLPTLRNRSVADAPRDGQWLIKPIRSGGGQGIFVWDKTCHVKTDQFYLQEFRPGRPISALFFASKCGIELIGISEQLIGRDYEAPSDFVYAGSIGPITVPDQTRQLIELIGHELAGRANLSGLFGVDFIWDDDVPWLTEVNPRYTASAEIYERVWGQSLVAKHIRGVHGSNPIRATQQLVGKRIVYAAADTIAPDLEAKSAGLADFIADIPVPGSRIAAGWPICTVFAVGESELAIRAFLMDRTHAVRQQLQTSPRL